MHPSALRAGRASRGAIMRVERLARAVVLTSVLLSAVSGCGQTAQTAQTPATTTTSPARPAGDPRPPSFPDNFQWTGRYVVPDLKAEVPFTWNGSAGNMQMVAGSENDTIHFTNLVYGGQLYTLTYKWPGVPRNPCSNVGPFTIADLNKGLESARFVGAETLEDRAPRQVHHFRAGVVYEPPPGLIGPIPGVPQVRIPLMFGDIYVDRDDPTKFWKVLQFGLQNLYDKDLDEWIVIDQSEPTAGTVTLPDECAQAVAPATASPATP